MSRKNIKLYIKWALQVIEGYITLDAVRRKFSLLADYYYWYLHYYTPLVNAKKRINAIKSGTLGTEVVVQGLTSTIADIFDVIREKKPFDLPERNDLYDWQIDKKGVKNQNVVKIVDRLIGKYVDEVRLDYYNKRPTIFASVNQLSKAYTALRKLDPKMQGIGRLTLAVLFGVISVEELM